MPAGLLPVSIVPPGLFVRELFVLAALITRFYCACGLDYNNLLRLRVGYVNFVCACGFNCRNNTFFVFLVLIRKSSL